MFRDNSFLNRVPSAINVAKLLKKLPFKNRLSANFVFECENENHSNDGEESLQQKVR